MYFIFGTFFTLTIECTAYVYGSEIWPTHRSESATITFVSFFGNAVACSVPVTLALTTIGWKFYMVFMAVSAATAIIFILEPREKCILFLNLLFLFLSALSLLYLVEHRRIHYLHHEKFHRVLVRYTRHKFKPVGFESTGDCSIAEIPKFRIPSSTFPVQ